MGTEAMKLKDIVSWKKIFDQPREHIRKQRHHFANKGPSSQGYGFLLDFIVYDMTSGKVLVDNSNLGG